MNYESARELIEPFEGRVSHIYLDIQGYVTVGIGFMLPTAQQALPLDWKWRDPATFGEPNEVDISDEWARVSRARPGMMPGSYHSMTSMDLNDGDIDRLFNRTVDKMVARLVAIYPEYSKWPMPAQLAVLDMAWNLGPNALPLNWPKLSAALRRRDWQEAALHSHRSQSHARRNEAIQGLFVRAAQEASAARTG